MEWHTEIEIAVNERTSDDRSSLWLFYKINAWLTRLVTDDDWNAQLSVVLSTDWFGLFSLLSPSSTLHSVGISEQVTTTWLRWLVEAGSVNWFAVAIFTDPSYRFEMRRVQMGDQEIEHWLIGKWLYCCFSLKHKMQTSQYRLQGRDRN